MGERVLTLADLWPARPRAMVVGLNPAPVSVAAGHYYQGRAGQRQLARLVDVGLIPEPGALHLDDVALSAGIGFTDIVKRPSKGERDVTADEIARGTRELRRKLERTGAPLIVCVFRHPVEALLGSTQPAGLSPLKTPWGAQVFRLPGPFEAKSRAIAVMDELRQILQ